MEFIKDNTSSLFIPVFSTILSINKYKKIEYVQVEYPPTEEILAEIDKLNKEVEKETKELYKLLGL